MAQFQNMYEVDLWEGAALEVSLKQIHYGDHKANRVGAIVLMEGVPYPLGGNCAGTAILANGSTVPLTGAVDGNQAYVELDNACYQVEGQIDVFVAWVSGTMQTTLLHAAGTVRITETGTVIQPSTPIPDLAQLMAQITAMQEATAAANAAATKSVRYDSAQSLTDTQKAQARDNIDIDETIAGMAVRYDTDQTLTGAEMATGRVNIQAAHYTDLAPIFSAGTSYSAGDIVVYGGNLMRFLYDHSGAWTGDDAASVNIVDLALSLFVRYDEDQGLTGGQKLRARLNTLSAYLYSLAEEFSTDQAYAIGDIAAHDGYIWRFTSAHAAGAWSLDDAELVPIAYLLSHYCLRVDIQQSLSDYYKYTGRANLEAAHWTSLADEFVLANSYNAGDMVIYQGDLIRFTQNHSGGSNPTVSEIELVDIVTLYNNGPVMYNKAQSLTDAQKSRAVQNIGAARIMDVDSENDSSGTFIKY